MIAAKSPISYHRQLADHVRAQIAAGEFAPGMLLPTERQLMELHNLSGVTVRQAMDRLAGEGLIVRRRGKGTFVAPLRVHSDLSIFSGFYDALVAAGLEIEVRITAFEPRSRPAHELTLRYDSALFIERLYITEDAAIAVSRSELHPRAAALQRANVEGRTNFDVLTGLLNFEMGSAELAIRARLPSPDIARMLALGAHEPILELHRSTFDTAGEPIGCSIFFITAERFEFGLSARHDRDVVHALRSV